MVPVLSDDFVELCLACIRLRIESYKFLPETY